jgi:hypothetical protein
MSTTKKTAKRIATVQYLGITFDVDVDAHWKRFLGDTPPNQLGSISTDLHFLIQLGCMDLSYPIKTRFLKFYSDPSKIKHRGISINGLVSTNYEAELNILREAALFQHKRTTGKYRDNLDVAHMDMTSFAVEFAEIVQRRDVPALRRMINIIEAGGVPSGERGGVGSADRYMLEMFCKLHLATRSLPTKKQLRNACGLGKLEDEKLAAKRMKKLGLWGLPTEPEI